MSGRIILVGAGELMSTMSGQHRVVLNRLQAPPRPVFLDTTAGFETNVDTIVAKAVEYYDHHLQTELRVARYRHRERDTAADLAAAVAEIRAANLIFAGPGSPTYAVKQWTGSPVWDAVVERFEAGADVFFASAASITLGRHVLPVYEIYKAGEDPYWADGLDLLGRFGLKLAVVPHFNDNSGGENYDSRFCYMGAHRFDLLQQRLPADVAILGIDAYTGIVFDPATQEATVSGQGGVSLIGDGAERRLESGESASFSAFSSSARGFVRTYDESRIFGGYAFSDNPSDSTLTDGFGPVLSYVEALPSLKQNDRIDLMARIQGLRDQIAMAPSTDEGPLVELVLQLREALRTQKQFATADFARKALEDLGYEIGDTPEGSTWKRP